MAAVQMLSFNVDKLPGNSKPVSSLSLSLCSTVGTKHIQLHKPPNKHPSKQSANVSVQSGNVGWLNACVCVRACVCSKWTWDY